MAEQQQFGVPLKLDTIDIDDIKKNVKLIIATDRPRDINSVSYYQGSVEYNGKIYTKIVSSGVISERTYPDNEYDPRLVVRKSVPGNEKIATFMRTIGDQWKKNGEKVPTNKKNKTVLDAYQTHYGSKKTKIVNGVSTSCENEEMPEPKYFLSLRFSKPPFKGGKKNKKKNEDHDDSTDDEEDDSNKRKEKKPAAASSTRLPVGTPMFKLKNLVEPKILDPTDKDGVRMMFQDMTLPDGEPVERDTFHRVATFGSTFLVAITFDINCSQFGRSFKFAARELYLKSAIRTGDSSAAIEEIIGEYGILDRQPPPPEDEETEQEQEKVIVESEEEEVVIEAPAALRKPTRGKSRK